MKQIKLIVVIALTILTSCSSSERVITNDGKVYTVKGNSFYTNDKDVTDKLTKVEKENIQSILEKRHEVKKAEEKKQDQIDESLKQLKQKEKELNEQQKQLDHKIEAREDARDDFFEIRKKLNSVKDEYTQLKNKGGLSPNDEEKWQKRLKKLEQKLKEAELKINN